MGIFKTGIIATIIGGGAVFGAVAYTGGGSIGEGIDLITKQDAQLETFKANENKLIAQLQTTTNVVQNLQSQIAAKNKQIADLIEEGGDNVKKIAELQAQVADLTAQLAEKTAELEALNAEIAAGKTDLTDDANIILKEIDRLQGEINEANADAQLLQDAVDRAGDVPTSNTEAVDSAIAEAQSAASIVPDAPVTEPEVDPTPSADNPNGLLVYKMNTGSPKVLNTDLTADVNANGELTIRNKAASAKYTAIVNGVEYTINAGQVTVIGSVSSLDKSEMILKDRDGDYVSGGKFWLTNQ